MAYAAGDYRITVYGINVDTETWVNTWSIKGANDPGDAQEAVDVIHLMYSNWSADRMGTEWSATGATYRNLLDGIATDAAWDPTPGQLAGDMLPPQLAVRVSLDDLLGHRGGPFLSGFTEAANAADGKVATVWQDDIADEVVAMNTGLIAAGMTLGIDRPSVPEVVNAARVRIGARWDVIRRRANNVSEVYDSRDL